MNRSLTRRTIVAVAASLAATRIARALPAMEPKAVAYTGFKGRTYLRVPYVGRRVALLLDPARKVESTIIEFLLDSMDRGHDWYRETFGREPAPDRIYQGRLTIAETPPEECAACGLFGGTGIQLPPAVIDLMMKQAKRGCSDPTVFYEFGRNFYFCPEATANNHNFNTGFAHANRFFSIDGAGLVGGPWEGSLSGNRDYDYDAYRHGMLVDMLNRYLADPKLTWQSTIGADKPPPNPHPWGFQSDCLMAAFFNLIRRDRGMEGYRRFWRMMAGAVPAKDLPEAMARYVQIARAVVGEDYRELLRDKSLPIVAMLEAPTLRGIEAWSIRSGGTVIGDVKRQHGNAFVQTNRGSAGSWTYYLLTETSEEAYLIGAPEEQDIYVKLDFVRRMSFVRAGTSGPLNWSPDYRFELSDFVWRG